MAARTLKWLERRFRKLLLMRQTEFHGRLIRDPDDAIPLGTSPAILLLRAERIGDALVTVPILRAIRRRFPSATIDILLTDANAQARLAFRPWIDHVWILHKRPTAALALLRTIRKRKYDLLVDFQNGPSTTSQLAARWGGATHVLGFLHAKPAYLTHAVVLPDRRRVHIVDRLGQLLLAFGLDPASESLDLEYPLSEADRSSAAARLGAAPEAYRIAVNVSGRGAHKYWGRERFIAAIRFLQQRFPQLAIVVCGAPGDAGEVQAVAAATGATPLPPLPFHAFAAVISECDFVLTPDTSVVHLAASWKIPAVVLFREDPHTVPWVPYRSPHRAIVHRGPLAGIPVEPVLTALAELIEETSNGTGPTSGLRGRLPDA